MANTFITPTAIAKVGILALLNNLCFANLIYRDYSKEFQKVGDFVRVRKPFTPSAVEFDGDLAGEWQNITETYIDVKMDTLLVIPLQITSVEQTLDIVDFNKQVMVPAMQELSQAIDVKLAQRYKDVPYYSDTTGATAVSDLLDARKIQNDNKVPFGEMRNAVLSPLTSAAVLGLAAFHEVDKVGETKPLRDASLGHKFGYDFYENQNIQNHVTHASITADPGGTAAICLAGVTSMLVSALGAAGTIYQGTIFTIAGDAQRYVVTADAAIAGAVATISFYPALKVATPLGTEVVTFKTTATTSKENLMFHKNAFAMVSAPMTPPRGGAAGHSETYKGLTLNVIESYEHDKFTNKLTVSILCGFKTINPELALRLYDAS